MQAQVWKMLLSWSSITLTSPDKMTILASSTQNLFSILNPFVQFFLSIAPQKPSCMKDICLPNKVHVIACNDSPPLLSKIYITPTWWAERSTLSYCIDKNYKFISYQRKFIFLYNLRAGECIVLIRLPEIKRITRAHRYYLCGHLVMWASQSGIHRNR